MAKIDPKYVVEMLAELCASLHTPPPLLPPPPPAPKHNYLCNKTFAAEYTTQNQQQYSVLINYIVNLSGKHDKTSIDMNNGGNFII